MLLRHVRSSGLFVAAILVLPALLSEAQTATLVKVEVVDGKAMATVRGPAKVKGKLTVTEKNGRIASHALQAWIVQNGQGALLLLSPEKKGGQPTLRYYEADAAKSRPLGELPFSQAAMTETTTSAGSWAFALSGMDPSAGQPAIYAGDTQALHARLAAASDPHFSPDALSFQSSGKPSSLAISRLMGQEAWGQLYAPRTPSPHAEYLQFLPDGTSIVTQNSQPKPGKWLTDGYKFYVTAGSRPADAWALSELNSVTGIPAGSRLNVRLLAPLSSRTAKKGTPVEAVLISPAMFDGKILTPQGSEFHGVVVDGHGVGWGIRRETAALTLHFDTVKLPDGRTLPIDARVFRVENSREVVTDAGTIQGIRATGTLGHSAVNEVASLVQIDPIAYLFTASSGTALLGFAEPEILYNAGTELDIAFNLPVITSQEYAPRVPGLDLTGEPAAQFATLFRDLPFRTHTQGSNQPSDITNLVFFAQPEALHRAFLAAGWREADTLTAAATFETVKTLAGNQTYTQAPMSVLMLGEEKPLFTMEKSTNTFSSRHHVRVFATGETFAGQPVLTASSTQDIAIAFSYQQKTFIHVIDQYLDNERSKVTNDLEFTGCVNGLDLVPRPWVPQDAYNATGDRLLTDGDAAVLRLTNCQDPHATPSTPARRAPAFERTERDTMLSIKDTLYRGNLIYTGIAGGIKVHQYLQAKGELGPETGAWRRSDASGTGYRVVNTTQPQLQPRNWAGESVVAPAELSREAKAQINAHKWDPPQYEIALNLGYSNYRNQFLEAELIGLFSSNNEPDYLLAMAANVSDGWTAGVSLTLNSWKWISNEFLYQREQTKFQLEGIEDFGVEGAPPPLSPDGKLGYAAFCLQYRVQPASSEITMAALHCRRTGLPVARTGRRPSQIAKRVFSAGPLQHRPPQSCPRLWRNAASRWRRPLPIRSAIRRGI
jgi:hypothetical protein